MQGVEIAKFGRYDTDMAAVDFRLAKGEHSDLTGMSIH